VIELGDAIVAPKWKARPKCATVSPEKTWPDTTMPRRAPSSCRTLADGPAQVRPRHSDELRRRADRIEEGTEKIKNRPAGRGWRRAFARGNFAESRVIFRREQKSKLMLAQPAGRDSSGSSSILIPSASSTSALPACEVMARFAVFGHGHARGQP